jgi:hypothetical protein
MFAEEMKKGKRIRYINNPSLKPDELSTLRAAVNLWRTSQSIPCRPRSGRLYETVEVAHNIAIAYPNLAPDLVRLTSSRNPCLAFYAFLTLTWIDSDVADSCRTHMDGLTFSVVDGCFVCPRSLDATLDAVLLHYHLMCPLQQGRQGSSNSEQDAGGNRR